MKLMIVDDHAGVREMIRALVCSPDDEVRECESADEAIRVAPEFQPEFVTMDLWMPGLNSFKGIQAMLQTNPTAKIVVVTAYDQRGLRDAAQEAGAVHYILKENLSELRNVLNLPPLNASVPAARAHPVHADRFSGMQNPLAQLSARVEELEYFPTFAANELRAPLKVIENFLAILQRQPAAQATPEIQSCASGIEAACRLMNQQIEVLLDFAASGGNSLQWETITTEKLIKDAWEDVGQRTPTDQVCFKMFRMPSISGDPNLLRFVFVHLLDNAVKFSAARSQPVIEVSCCDMGSYSVFAVTDNGVGFDMQHAERLFLPLSRLPASDKYPGRGLGLALAHRIVQQHGGRIWAEGKVDHGATIYFTLPRPPLS